MICVAFDQAVNYLDSFEEDGYCKIVGFDVYSNTIWIETDDQSFYPIIETYIWETWGIKVRAR